MSLSPRNSGLSKDDAPADSELLARVREGDADALNALVRTYATVLIAFAARQVGSEDLAQEIVQDVFLQIWADRARLERTYSVAPYLFWITRNRAIDVARTEAAARRREGRWARDADIESIADNAGDRVIMAAEIRALVWDALVAVPLRCREIFMLVWDQQLSYAEVASRLGISVLTVRNQMSRALKHLVDTLGPQFRLG